MTTNSKPTKLNPLHDLTFLYMYFAQLPDDSIGQEEAETLIAKIYEWCPSDENHASNSIDEGMAWYKATTDWDSCTNEVAACCDRLKDKFDKSQLKLILDDLWEIAQADGEVIETEKNLFTAIGSRWGINIEIK